MLEPLIECSKSERESTLKFAILHETTVKICFYGSSYNRTNNIGIILCSMKNAASWEENLEVP